MSGFFVKNLGCKVNQYDATTISNQLKQLGFDACQDVEGADVTIINTCSVTENAEKEARYLARKFKRINPQTKLVVTGCYAQTQSASLVAMPEIDMVVANDSKHELAENLARRFFDPSNQNSVETSAENKFVGKTSKPVDNNKQQHFKSSLEIQVDSSSQQTRAFLKIQDGCNNFCTYCIIPYARGASRSMSRELALNQLKQLSDQNYPEIVLTGIHIGDYGWDEHASQMRNSKATPPIVELLEEAIQSIPNLPRIRISSLEPAELSDELIELYVKYPKVFCPHFHLPLQSGSENILRKMRREYTAEEYQNKITKLRSKIPQVSIGADIIPGFPGETEAEHNESLEFVRDLKLSYLHVFPYSSRSNTAASRMPGHLDPKTIQDRAKEFRKLDEKLRQDHLLSLIGQQHEAIWETGTDSQGRHIGRLSLYPEVVAASGSSPKVRTISSVIVKGICEDNRLLVKVLQN